MWNKLTSLLVLCLVVLLTFADKNWSQSSEATGTNLSYSWTLELLVSSETVPSGLPSSSGSWIGNIECPSTSSRTDSVFSGVSSSQLLKSSGKIRIMSSPFLAVLSDNLPYNNVGLDLLSVHSKRPQVKMSPTQNVGVAVVVFLFRHFLPKSKIGPTFINFHEERSHVTELTELLTNQMHGFLYSPWWNPYSPRWRPYSPRWSPYSPRWLYESRNVTRMTPTHLAV